MGEVIVPMQAVYDAAERRKHHHVDGDHWAALGMGVGEEISVPMYGLGDGEFDDLWALGNQLGFSMVPVSAMFVFSWEIERLMQRLEPGYRDENVPDWVRSKWPDGAIAVLDSYSACALKMALAVQERLVSWLDGLDDVPLTERQSWALIDSIAAMQELLRFGEREWR